MFQFTNSSPDFFIQLKGLRAGQPLKFKISNSVGIKTDPGLLVPGFLFYTVLFLYQSGRFRPFLKGTAVPFIRQKDVARVIISHFQSLNPSRHENL